MKWVKRWFVPPSDPGPFDCQWCSRDGGHRRHDMCTGVGLQPESLTRNRAYGACACALRQHQPARDADRPQVTRFPVLPDGWVDRVRLRSKKQPPNNR